MRQWLAHNLIFHHIHLLQLENYAIRRYLRAVREQFVRTADDLPDITWTYKLYLVTILGLLLQMYVTSLIAKSLSFSLAVTIGVGLVLFVLLSYLFFVFLVAATIVVWPLDQLARRFIIWRAKRKLEKTDPAIVAVAGSYGKTTMKQTIATLLEEKKSVAKTPGNKNTPLGIARAIQNELTPETDVFVVEMGEYHRGDIKELCDITRPDISVVTGINEAHLERFGSLENTIAAILEVVEYAREDATVIGNADDERVREHIDRAKRSEQELRYYSAHNHKNAPYRTTDREFYTDGSGISFELMKGSERIGTFKVPHLAEYIIGNVIAALLVGETLNIPPHEIRSGISRLEPAPHRLEVLKTPDPAVVIDDSYNGNPDGARAAIETLGKFTDRRKIYITPGLVEMGERSKRVHRAIGRELAPVADVVVLIETTAAGYIKEGLSDEGYEGGIVMVDSMHAAKGYLSAHVKEDDVVLFQNDWPDNYT